MVMKVLTVFFALAASTVQADNCVTLSSGTYQLKASLAGVTCSGAATTVGSSCLPCCVKVPNICKTAEGAPLGKSCTGDFFEDNAKDLAAVDATASNYQANCCTAKKTCDIACTGGTDKTGKATIKCRKIPCTINECCDITATTCSGLMLSGAGSCTGDTRYTNGATTATTATYQATCCVAKKTCDVTCPAGEKDKTDKATIKCMGATCKDSECCDDDSSKCKGLAATGCNANEFANPATAGSAATAATYKTACCIAKGTCSAFSTQSVAASLAKTTQVPTVAFLLLTFGGALAFGQ